MCLLLVAWKLHPHHDLVLAANRDEQHDRATGALDFWADLPEVAGGRDLVAGGTWLAVHRDGRFAAVTNYRGSRPPADGAPSRGDLVTRYLAGTQSPREALDALEPRAADYAGFSLILGDREELWYATNRAQEFAQRLGPGIYGLSNDLLDTAWPKLSFGTQAMREHVDLGRSDAGALFAALERRESDPAPDLPWPASSGPFIEHERFGTRAMTLVRREAGHTVLMEERRFGPLGKALGRTRLAVPPRGGRH